MFDVFTVVNLETYFESWFFAVLNCSLLIILKSLPGIRYLMFRKLMKSPQPVKSSAALKDR